MTRGFANPIGYSSASRVQCTVKFVEHFIFSTISAAMDSDLYDEFGNYIGPELDSDSEAEMPAQQFATLGTAAMVRTVAP